MEIGENELWILSYYRASELAGALILGRLASETEDDELRARLTEHCAEEAEHARMWSDTIRAVGGLPRRVPETYQSRYRARLGAPATMLEVLALTHVFERRVVRHFRSHLRRPDVHPAVAETLRGMIADEAGHLGWVRDWLRRYAREHGRDVVAAALRRLAEVDRQVYAEVVRHRDDVARLWEGARTALEIDGPRGAPTGAAAPAGAERPRVERAVRRAVSRVVRLPEGAVRLDASLEELGTDSLDLLEVVTELEDALHVEIGVADGEGWRTLRDVVDTLERLLQTPHVSGATEPGANPTGHAHRQADGPRGSASAGG